MGAIPVPGKEDEMTHFDYAAYKNRLHEAAERAARDGAAAQAEGDSDPEARSDFHFHSGRQAAFESALEMLEDWDFEARCARTRLGFGGDPDPADDLSPSGGGQL
jgi:hypothetical protein